MPVNGNVIGGRADLEGYAMPLIGLGISRIEGQDTMDVSIRAALAAGYRQFDTANLYKNEQELGDALKKHLPEFGLSREDIFLTTKVQILNDDPVKACHQQLQESFQKLGTDYLDLVLSHFPRDRNSGKDEEYELNKKGRKAVWDVLREYKKNGKIKRIGVSNYEVYHLVEMNDYCEGELPSINQVEYHPYLTRPTLKFYCESRGIKLQAFSSLCWGDEEILNEKVVMEISKKHQVTPQIVLYAFALATGVIIIPKSKTPVRIEENIKKVAQIYPKLTTEELRELNDLDRNTVFCPRCYPWRCL